MQALDEAGVRNPVIILDEIDKVGGRTHNHGDPSAALIELLDPEQNTRFRLRHSRDLLATLPAFPGDLTDDIQPTPSTHLMTGEGAINAFNMVAVYGLRTDGCGCPGRLREGGRVDDWRGGGRRRG